METKNQQTGTDRRKFLASLATGAAAAGLAAIPSIDLRAEDPTPDPLPDGDPDAWFNKVKGKHRIVFDNTAPHEVLNFAWPRVFLLTNAATGTPEKDCGVVVILRHGAIPFAFENRIWEKYGFGKVFKVEDTRTKAEATVNPFWMPAKGDYKVPGFGEVQIGINELQSSGVMICVCGAAMTVYSTVIAGQMNMKPEDVLNDWKSGLLPGIQIVPSGVWAVGRAQEHGCQYCFVS